MCTLRIFDQNILNLLTQTGGTIYPSLCCIIVVAVLLVYDLRLFHSMYLSAIYVIIVQTQIENLCNINIELYFKGSHIRSAILSSEFSCSKSTRGPLINTPYARRKIVEVILLNSVD